MTRTKKKSLDVSGLFDKVYCINLDCRPDRWERMQAELPAMGLPVDTVERWPAQRTHPGRFGAAMAHRGIMEKQLAEGWERVLVLEDDTQLNRRRALHSLDKILDDGPWDVMYLGCQANPKTARIISEGEHTFHLRGVTGGFALLYSSRMCRVMMEIVPEDGKLGGEAHFDRVVEQLCQGDMTARGPKNSVYSHTIVGRSDTDEAPRIQGASAEYHRKWYQRMKDLYRLG